MLMLLCSAALPSAAAPESDRTRADADWILRALAQPAPMRTDFVELRGSSMLKAPLRLQGEYRRPDNVTLVREVRVPYVETTTLRQGQASIARPGKPVRNFALSRAPELAQLQAGFGALLSGDRALLETQYQLAPQGTRQQWTLLLTPVDTKLKMQLHDITLHGQGEELRCIETRPAKGDLQRTLLGSAAKAAAPDATANVLADLCHGG